MHTLEKPRSAASICVYILIDNTGDELAVARQERLASPPAIVWVGLHRLYVDNDRSATNGKRRDDYQRLLGDISGGAIQAVMVWQQDRLFRDPGDAEAFNSIAEPLNVPLLTPWRRKDLAEPTDLYMMQDRGRWSGPGDRQDEETPKGGIHPSAPTSAAHGGRRRAVRVHHRPAGTAPALTGWRPKRRLIRDAYSGGGFRRSFEVDRPGLERCRCTLPRRGNRWSGMRYPPTAPRSTQRRVARLPRRDRRRSVRPAIVASRRFDGDAIICPTRAASPRAAGFGTRGITAAVRDWRCAAKCGHTVVVGDPDRHSKRPTYAC